MLYNFTFHNGCEISLSSPAFNGCEGSLKRHWALYGVRGINIPCPGSSLVFTFTEIIAPWSHRHNSYLITWHGKKIFISGDTENPETIGKMSGMDWAFVPSWILFGAREKNIKIDAKNIAIYHLYPNEKYNVVTPGIVLMDRQGKEMEIPY